MRKDQFRTSAVEITTLFNTNDHVWGIGVGSLIWGGTTDGTERKGHRTLMVDVRDNYGGAYSHGVLYLAGYYDSFKLSIGVDSEEIRSAIQNSWHFLLNQSNIAVNPTIRPTFYIQLTINPRYSLW